MTMVLAVMYREFRIRTTSLTWLFYDLLVPLVYLLMFGIGLDRAFAGGVTVHGTTVSYNAFFLAGVLSMACFGIAINTAYGFFVDRDNGILYEFLTYPMSRAEFLIGKILVNCLLAVAQATLTIGLGAGVLGIPVSIGSLPAALAVMVIGTAAWFFALAGFALRIRRNDVFNTFLNVAYFVLMFGSSMFYPVDSLPRALRIVSAVNPLSWHTDLLRYFTIGAGDPATIAAEAIAFAVFLAAAFVFALDTLRRGIVK
jgi:ABC-2 type transport system permease protein